MYGDKISWLQRFMQRFQPTPITMAKAELKDAQLAALQSQSMAEYAELRKQIHDLTTQYHHGRIDRLRAFLGIDINPFSLDHLTQDTALYPDKTPTYQD